MTDFSQQSNEELADLFYEHRTAMKVVEKELIKRLAPGQCVQGSTGYVILDREYKDKIKYLGGIE